MIKKKEYFSWENTGDMGFHPVNKWNSNGILGKSFYLSFRFHLFLKKTYLIRTPPPDSSSQHSYHAIYLQEIAITTAPFLSLIFQLPNRVIWELKELLPWPVNMVVIIHKQKNTVPTLTKFILLTYFKGVGLVLIQETIST